MSGRYKSRNQRPDKIPYPTMSVEEIVALPIAGMAGEDAHLWLWLWTTNQFLEDGFRVMRAWGSGFSLCRFGSMPSMPMRLGRNRASGNRHLPLYPKSIVWLRCTK